ncbi:MAG: DUF4249 family protein [Lewinella sp.]|nr:DUF4249 family protein [Lewinella sp.]
MLGQLVVGLAFGCEREFTPPLINTEAQIVVEGYVEAAGENSAPPYVILTRSLPFFRQLDSAEFNDFFVHDAFVTVNDGEQTVTLIELCLSRLTPEQLALAEDFLGTNISQVSSNFCVYLDPSLSMLGEAGKTYELRIEVEGKLLTASSTHSPTPRFGYCFFLFLPPGKIPVRV